MPIRKRSRLGRQGADAKRVAPIRFIQKEKSPGYLDSRIRLAEVALAVVGALAEDGIGKGHSSRPPRQFSRAYRARELNAADDWLSSRKPHPLIAIRPWVWLNGASEKVKARQGQSSLESALMQHITPLLHRDNPPSLSLSGPLSL